MNEDAEKLDLFISYTSSDYQTYVFPLIEMLKKEGITYWLDKDRILLGDSITGKINEGLNISRYVLLCLSKNYMARSWPITEMKSVFSKQISSGINKIIPVILNSQSEILNKFPLISDLKHFDVSEGLPLLKNELLKVINIKSSVTNAISVKIESAHRDLSFDLAVSPKESIEYFTERARSMMGLGNEARIEGAPFPMPVRWVLIDVNAEIYWDTFNFEERNKIIALVKTKDKIYKSFYGYDRLESLNIYNGIVFHLKRLVDEEIERAKDKHYRSDAAVLSKVNHNTNKYMHPIQTVNNQYSQSIDELLEIGLDLSNRGQYLKAIVYFDKILLFEPHDKYALNNKAHCLNMLKEYNEAYKYINHSIGVDENEEVCWFTRGEILMNLKEFREALISFQKFEKLATFDSPLMNEAKINIKRLRKKM